MARRAWRRLTGGLNGVGVELFDTGVTESKDVPRCGGGSSGMVRPSD